MAVGGGSGVFALRLCPASGAGYEKEISFGVLVQLIADALLEHQGSGRKSFARGREQGLLTASVQAVYQKLGRVPLGLSEAWLAESTARVRPGVS